MYTKFTSNFMNAKLTIQQMRRQHSSFARFLEVGVLYPLVHAQSVSLHLFVAIAMCSRQP